MRSAIEFLPPPLAKDVEKGEDGGEKVRHTKKIDDSDRVDTLAS